MYEKISDKPIREEKVKKVKAKILAEIDKYLEWLKSSMELYLRDTSEYQSLETIVQDGFCLVKLKEYIEKDNSFMSYEAKYPDKDIVVYRVSDRLLNVWLQEKFSFVSNFLFRAENCNYNIFPIMNDYYFGKHFTSEIEIALYENRNIEPKKSRIIRSDNDVGQQIATKERND